MTRIIAGEARGRRLAVPRGRDVRPTGDAVRESIFAALGSLIDLRDIVVLDAFAGSGALGLEALSRGAARATFVERHPPTAAILRANVAALGFEARSTIVRADVMRWLADAAPATRPNTAPAPQAGRDAGPAAGRDADHDPGPHADHRAATTGRSNNPNAAGATAARFDVAFCDPPYRFDAWERLLGRLHARLLVAESDRAVVSHEAWKVLSERRRGSTVVQVARRQTPSGPGCDQQECSKK